MNFLKNKKKLILGISVTIFLCILCYIVFYLINNRTIKVAASDITNSSNIKTNITETTNNETNDVITVLLENEEDKKEADNNNKTGTKKETTNKKQNATTSKKDSTNKATSSKKEEVKSTSPYYIKVNYKANVVTVYKKDEKCNYTIPYKAMICSCGTYTPKSGTYKTSNKYTWRFLLHDVYGQYATRIVNKILFHSVPYSSNKKDALLYEEYDKLGTTASDGCVRLTVEDAKWIYNNCPSGTMVEFYSSSNPGPLGKPTAQKISSNIECRNWDPTDPASNNPWHTYNKLEEEQPVPDTPVTNEPTIETPPADTPSTDEPTVETLPTDNPSSDEPTIETPPTDNPGSDEPTIEIPPANTPSSDEPTIETPPTDNPGTDEPTIEIPPADTPSTDEPAIETPPIDKPIVDVPTTDTNNTMIIQ